MAPSKTWRIDNLQSDRHYYFYAVAQMDAENFSRIQCVQFNTDQYGLTDPITIMETYPDGYKVHVHVPDEVRARGNALRYALSNMAVYLKLKDMYGTSDRQMLLENGDAHGRALTRDHTFVINNDNINWLDEDGNEVYDESTGEAIYFHDPLVPGEPALFMVGEYRYGDSAELSGLSGWGDGYFGAVWEATNAALEDARIAQGNAEIILPDLVEIEKFNTFDNSKEDNGWTGVFDRKVFLVQEPEELDAELTIEVPENGISVVDADVRFTMGDGIYGYCYAILDMTTYNAMLNLLDNRQDLLRWFMTSYLAMFELGVELQTENIAINAGSQFVGNLLSGNSDYIICATALGDERGLSQKYFEKKFKTNPPALAKPIFEVTPVYTDGDYELSDPFVATFNVKYTNAAEAGKLRSCCWAADYKREWDKAKSPYASIVGTNYKFTDEELEKISSPEGYNVTFSTLEGQVMRMVVYGNNEENEFNIIDETAEAEGRDCPAIADYRSPYMTAKAPVNTDYFETLVGEWEISAKIINVDADGKEKTVNYKSLDNVEISYGAPEYPEDLFEKVKPIYSKLGISEEDTRDYCDEFISLSKEFTENRCENQNRLLCTGFIDYDRYHELSTPLQGRLDKFTPYALFTSTSYSSVDVSQIFYDFGPKWFIEVDADGSAYVPFDANKLLPMHAWGGYVNYIAACTDKESGYLATLTPRDEVKGFPVTVSADRNEITIGSVKMTDVNGENKIIYEADEVTPRKSDYYMNVLGMKAMETEWLAPVVSEIKLKKVRTASSAAKTKAFSAPAVSRGSRASSLRPAMKMIQLPERPVMKDRSNVVKLDAKIKPVQYKTVEDPNIITRESLSKAIDNYYNRYRNAKK